MKQSASLMFFFHFLISKHTNYAKDKQSYDSLEFFLVIIGHVFMLHMGKLRLIDQKPMAWLD